MARRGGGLGVRGPRLEHDIGIAVLRSAVQLIALGYVIQPIFDPDSLGPSSRCSP